MTSTQVIWLFSGVIWMLDAVVCMALWRFVAIYCAIMAVVSFGVVVFV